MIADLPKLSRKPYPQDFLNHTQIYQHQAVINSTKRKIEAVSSQANEVTAQLSKSREEYIKSKKSFDNWRATRSSTKNPEQNPEVVAIAKRLDDQLANQQRLEAQLQEIDQNKRVLTKYMAPAQDAIAALHKDAEQQYNRAVDLVTLKVFMIRLAFVGPILLSALWLFFRYRKSAHWPFVWGFIYFALFEFFFQLVPYLPSFGGYIRYGVGVIMTLVAGRVLIRSLQQYLDKKRQEQKVPQEKRRHDILYEKALESMRRGQCPGCERTMPELGSTQVNFCMHCGMRNHDACQKCGLRNNAFYPFCPSCGTSASKVTE